MDIAASILIPTYNRRDSLEKLFVSLRKQSFTSFEAVVIDAGSNDGTVQLCSDYAKFFPLELIGQDGVGFVNAVNCGIRKAKAEVLIRIDDDVVLTDKWLQAVMDTFKNYPDAGCVTGPVITPEAALENRDVFSFQEKFKRGNIFWRLAGKFYNDFLLEGKPLAIGRDFKSGAFSFGANFNGCLKLGHPLRVDHPESCNMAFKKELSRSSGDFEESFTGTAEYCDSDLAYKIRALGYNTVFNPQAVLYHYPVKKGFYSMRCDPYHRMINFIRFYRRHIKADSLEKAVRFFAYLLFLNGYFFFNFVKFKDPKQLKSFPATFAGLLRPLKRL